MDVSAEINYPDTTPDEAWAMLLDPEFRTQVCEDTLALGYDINIEEGDDGGAVVTIARTMPAEVPDFVKKFVGETIDIKQVETWGPPAADGSRTGDFRMDIVGQPASMTGTMTFGPSGDGVLETVKGQLKVAIPFFGSKVEPEVAKGVRLGLRQEEKTGQKWLAEH